MPTPKMPVFKQPDKHKTKAAVQREIRQLIVSLRDTIPKSDHGEELIRFLGVIYPGKAADVTRLPINSQDGSCELQDRAACLYCKVSQLIQAYWDYCLNDDGKITPVRAIIEELKEVTIYGVNHYQVVGNPKSKYRLELLKRGEK